MPTSLALLAGLLAATPVFHTGEWRTVIDGKPPQIACLPADRTLGEAILMARRPGASCQVTRMTTTGAVTSFSFRCAVSYVLRTTTIGTTVAEGPDVFTTTAHTHADAFGMDTGQPIAVPDTTMTMVSQRLGPCRPGDRVDPQ